MNQRYYIGAHKTLNLDDGYMGSGKAITNAIRKYGLAAFTKEILFTFDNKESMFDKETELVTEEVVRDRKSYNLKPGGIANFYFVNENGLNHKANQHLIFAERMKVDPEYKKRRQDKIDASIQKYHERMRASNTPIPLWHRGKTKETEPRLAAFAALLKEKRRGQQLITDSTTKKFLLRDLPMPEGWRLVRKQK